MPEVLCVADFAVDLIVTGDVVPRFGQVEQWVDDYFLELGGSATIFASQYARLGGSIGVAGRLGRDFFSVFVRKELYNAGVDLEHTVEDGAIKTSISLALTRPADRAILSSPGSITAARPRDLERIPLQPIRHWHIASYFLLTPLRAFWPDWLHRCRDAGLSVSLDTNWDPEEKWVGVEDLLPLIDVFLPNEAEARAITGEPDLEKAAIQLGSQGPLVVIKRGAEGALACFGGELLHVPGHPVDPASIIDTIGSGDNFDAGFLRAWLLGWPVEDAMRLACRCGAHSLSRPGGCRGQLEEAVRAPS